MTENDYERLVKPIKFTSDDGRFEECAEVLGLEFAHHLYEADGKGRPRRVTHVQVTIEPLEEP